MELYIYVIKLFLSNKSIYLKYKDVVDFDFIRSNFPEVLRLFKAVEELHTKGAKEEYACAELEAALFTLYPRLEMDIYAPLLAKVEAASPDKAAILGYLQALRQRVGASKLAFAALDVAEGKAEAEALRVLAAEYVETHGAGEQVAEETFVSDDIDVLVERAYAEGGLRWRLKSLNRALGPLRRGDFGFIFARPETGKTTFLASEVTFMCPQAQSPVLWFNNEEVGEKVGIRCYEAALGATFEQILGHKERARDKYFEVTKRRLKIVDNASINRRDIQRICENVRPSLIVLDQLDKVGGFDGDREDLRMGAIYQWARELAKKYAPVIGVSQSDGSGEGVKYLNMGNVANAKTAKQAEADWILGIGLSYDDHPRVRGLSICKNKLLGGEETIPKMRHAKFDVLIEPEIGRFADMEAVVDDPT
jgi:nucleotide-binding universal stress UspA family protein